MRRKDRECLEPEFMQDVLTKADTLYIAMHDGMYPYCLPFNFALLGNHLYIHSAKSGKKLECLEKNPRVAFCAAVDIEIDTQNATTRYRSVCGQGTASVVSDAAEKRQALAAIARKYEARCTIPASDADINRVQIIGIAIDTMTGKWARARD